MEKLYRKVYDRLPNLKDGTWVDTSLGDIQFDHNQIINGVWKYHGYHAIEWWLEEVESPIIPKKPNNLLCTEKEAKELAWKAYLIRTGKLKKWCSEMTQSPTPTENE